MLKENVLRQHNENSQLLDPIVDVEKWKETQNKQDKSTSAHFTSKIFFTNILVWVYHIVLKQLLSFQYLPLPDEAFLILLDLNFISSDRSCFFFPWAIKDPRQVTFSATSTVLHSTLLAG